MVVALHLSGVLKKKNVTQEAYVAMSTDERKPLQSEAMKLAKEAYLACLFIMMADGARYGGVKAALGDNYLLGKQEYPQDLLAAKRLLADYRGVPGKARKAAAAADDQGVAFAEGGKTEYVPTCHGCGNKCHGGYRKCTNITEEHRFKMAALDAQGHFRRGTNNNKKRTGTVNVAAGSGTGDGDEDDDGDNTSQTETSDISQLTQDITHG